MGTSPAYDEESWIILAVDYSKLRYNIGLITISEDGLVDPVPCFDKEQQLEAMGQSLRHIIANPPDHVHDLLKKTHQIIICGDDATLKDRIPPQRPYKAARHRSCRECSGIG